MLSLLRPHYSHVGKQCRKISMRVERGQFENICTAIESSRRCKHSDERTAVEMIFSDKAQLNTKISSNQKGEAFQFPHTLLAWTTFIHTCEKHHKKSMHVGQQVFPTRQHLPPRGLLTDFPSPSILCRRRHDNDMRWLPYMTSQGIGYIYPVSLYLAIIRITWICPPTSMAPSASANKQFPSV